MTAQFIARALAQGSVVRLADGRLASVAPATGRDRKAGQVRLYVAGQDDPEWVEYNAVVTLLYAPADLARRALAALSGQGPEAENAQMALRLADAEEQARALARDMADLRRAKDAASALAEHRGFLLERARERLEHYDALEFARAEQARLETAQAERLAEQERTLAALSAHPGVGGERAEAVARARLVRQRLERVIADHLGWDDMGATVGCACEVCRLAMGMLAVVNDMAARLSGGATGATLGVSAAVVGVSAA